MEKKKHNNKSHVVNEDEVAIDSFSAYEDSGDDKTRVKEDGGKTIESFHLYKEEDK
jgi:hypothetical protein